MERSGVALVDIPERKHFAKSLLTLAVMRRTSAPLHHKQGRTWIRLVG
jgi:hypothetical protein